LNSFASVLTPPSVDTISGVWQVATGAYFTCVVLRATGGVRCWGQNGNGQLGNGGLNSFASVLTPPSVNVISGVWQISCGDYHTCVVLSANGGVRCWGFNNRGQLGNGGTAGTYAPAGVDVISGVWQISCSVSITCAVMSANGGVRCWGSSNYGRLGNGVTTGNVLTPPSVDLIVGVSQIAVGAYHTCVVMSANGGVRCWGTNTNGALGTGNTLQLLTPPSVDVITGVSQISLGYGTTCVVLSLNGGVRCWGSNENGQLGNGDANLGDVLAPPTVDVISGVLQISTGTQATAGRHVCVVMSSDGGVQCWGANANGQLGINTIDTPLVQPTGTSVIAL